MKWIAKVCVVVAILAQFAGGVCVAQVKPAEEKKLELQPFSYREDFEEPREMALWATNGKEEIGFNGVTDEKAYSGKKSYKLDVTIKDGSYHYFGIKLRAPCAGELKFSARMWVETISQGASVGLGYNMLFPPTTHSGCSPFDTVRAQTQEWKLVTGDLVAAGEQTARGVMSSYTAGVEGKDVSPFLELWGLFIYGGDGAHVVVYVDDVKIEGKVPDAAAFEAQGRDHFAAAKARTQKRIADWRARVTAASDELNALPQPEGFAKKILDTARKNIESATALLNETEKRGYVNPSEVMVIENSLEIATNAGPSLKALADSMKEGLPYIPYVPKAITNSRITPDSLVIPGRIGREIAMAACPGEFESANFVLQTLAPIKGLRVEATDLTSGKGRIAKDAVNVRVVKCWYQAGISIGDRSHKQLTPELLLKDDALVRVDYQKQENYLRSTDAAGNATYLLCSSKDSSNLNDVQPRDADTMQPVDLDADSVRQFWITLHVPDKTPAGDYEGSIKLSAEGTKSSEFRLKVHVYPFQLAACPLRHSIYYRGILTPDGKGSVSSEQKSDEQYAVEMRDMHEHGVDYPTVYQAYDETLVNKMLELREHAGLPKGPLYVLGQGTGSESAPEKLAGYTAGMQRYTNAVKPLGYNEVYFYGADEATGEALIAQKVAWKNVQDTGGKTFVACYAGTFEVMGSLLNLAIYAGAPSKEEAEKYHKVGSQIFCYANPQVGNEEPETYRRNFGLLLWKNNFDGAMDYAYQHSFHHAWNDFDDSSYRDHVFAYPTVNGVVDTVEWEGYREAVDDVRYIATLQKAIEKARKVKARSALAAEAEKWMNDIDPSGDLDAIRKTAADWIVRLMK